MTARAKHLAVSRAEAVEVESLGGNVWIGSKGLIRCHSPVSRGVERFGVPHAIFMAHLASRFCQPANPSGSSDETHVAMTVGALPRRHGSSLAFRVEPRMTQIAGASVFLGLIQG